MCELVTRVETAFYPEYLNHWLRFGTPDVEHRLDRRRALAFFRPGRLFGYVRWSANAYGTQIWRLSIVRSASPGDDIRRIEGIAPGGTVLLSAVGKARVKRALQQIDALERDGFDPTEVSPAYFRHVHNRIAVGQPVRAYTPAQHAAHRAAQAVPK
jgi:hypothetical protein